MSETPDAPRVPDLTGETQKSSGLLLLVVPAVIVLGFFLGEGFA